MQTMPKPIILDICGGTGSWSRPYRDAGYDVRIIDPLHAIDNGTAYTDARLFMFTGERIRGVLAAPPCTHLSSSGARWWKAKGPNALFQSLAVADACMRIIAVHDPVWWALENPTGRLRHYYGPPSLSFDPCDYGDPYTKRTHLWGRFTHPVRTPVTPSLGSATHIIPPSSDRWRLRSVTPPGFANAFFQANP
jgi:hypothetical protein